MFLEITSFSVPGCTLFFLFLFPPSSKFLVAGELQRCGMIVALLQEIYEGSPSHPARRPVNL